MSELVVDNGCDERQFYAETTTVKIWFAVGVDRYAIFAAGQKPETPHEGGQV